MTESMPATHVFKGIPGTIGTMESTDKAYSQYAQQSVIQDQMSRYQALHAEQQSEYLKQDAKLAEEMGKMERDIASRSSEYRHYPGVQVEELKKMYDEALKKRVALKENFRLQHEVRRNNVVSIHAHDCTSNAH